MIARNNMVLIPSLDPDEKFIDYIKSLIDHGFKNIVVVNDGNSPSKDPIFNAIKSFDECKVIDHAVNLGKGRALKNGFNHCLNVYGNDVDVKYVITADSDGQHAVEDVVRMDEFSNSLPEASMVLGCRDFSSANVPFKSKKGNKITRSIFYLLYGTKITDTQTGLRSIPKEKLVEYMNLSGERFEFETNMLLYNSVTKSPLKEIQIKTVYYDNNSTSHFNPIRDSIAIYWMIINSFLKYVLSSLSSAIIDLGLFQLAIFILAGLSSDRRILISTIFARAISSLYNYFANRNLVFKSKGSIKKTLIKYYVLCVLQILISAAAVSAIYKLTGLPEVMVKLIVDTLLFILSFTIQRSFIFTIKSGGNNE
ncbi:MAG: GtrA family protein [Saccharofermentanales bacterium]